MALFKGCIGNIEEFGLEGSGILLAAHTNKNWFGLKKDIEEAIKDTNIQIVTDQEEKGFQKEV